MMRNICVSSVSKSIEFAWFLLIQAVFINSQSLKDIPSVFPHRLNSPGLNAQKKVWWAKEITPDFHVCGRLSDRQIKYAADAGFKSVLSLFTYPAGDPPGSFGGDYLPVTVAEKVIVEEVAGLQFIALLEPMDEWASVEAVEKFTAIEPTLKKPALLHCDRGYTIAFVTLLYMANQTRYNPDFQPKIRSKEFYEITASMGLDFLQRIPMETVSEITGEPIPDINDKSLPRANFEPEDWLDYWFAHPVYKNWFVAGQITKSHLSPLEEFGYKSVVNIREGMTYKGKPSQEEVNLLNIRDRTGTYGDAQTAPRQSEERLKETLINEHFSNSFISEKSTKNYENINEDEFGDIIGYNEDIEKKAFEDSGLKYYHIPLDNKMKDFATFIKENMDQLIEISKKGPVLVHCARGYRAAMVAVLASAVQYDLTIDWALQRLKEMGMGISAESHPHIYDVYKELLPSRQRVEL
ncbi:uncharacterized protein LOC101857383 isoform X2 [Aplysia californica]|uniref:Uncharacterized protein LOC101857383 isoform X2 n=1 Tax=Aplysia californica TaxID=6500 RepID=A0ABM0JCZ6_APLCA|nr:uncharacterized protein LOC101857383 isoform X2 [Aplysia californica]XP_005090862.1 uncharacterized protein LOC101857383 isoform X2 [Aplysia californica]XP_005090863.1 uncharacterized protein LOC101857383 isoform X2 [Aplysia californica]XP_012943287.1 uncharacterized protein LOC101857383 isoform X2 [Aplysia californica]